MCTEENPSEDKSTRQNESTAVQYTSALSEVKFKTELWAYSNAYCCWLFQAMLSCLSFGTHTLRWLRGAMQISVIGHPLEVPFQALQGHFMTGVAGSFRFQTARGPWPGAMAYSYGLTPN